MTNKPYIQADNGIDPIPAESHQSPRTKLANKAVLVAMLVIALSLGLIMKWAFQSETVIDVKQQPFPVRTIREHPTAAGVVFVKANLCKTQDVQGQVRVSFVSESREIFLPLAPEKLDKGCINQEIPVLIPYEIPAGVYKIKFRATYNLNPLKKGIVEEFTTKEVTIDPSTAKVNPAP